MAELLAGSHPKQIGNMFTKLKVMERKRFRPSEEVKDSDDRMLTFLMKNEDYEAFINAFPDIDNDSKTTFYNIVTGKNPNKKFKISENIVDTWSCNIAGKLAEKNIDLSSPYVMLIDMIKKGMDDQFILNVMSIHEKTLTVTLADIEKIRQNIVPKISKYSIQPKNEEEKNLLKISREAEEKCPDIAKKVIRKCLKSMKDIIENNRRCSPRLKNN